MLSVVCFSKDRPLQLDAYIQSLQYYGGVKPEFVTIIYTNSSHISYDKLIDRHPGVNWCRETAFQEDLVGIIQRSNNYVLFGCDDVVFKEFFDQNDCIRTLEKNPDIFGFSLRLGANLRFLPDLRQEGDVLRWNWRDAPPGRWSYPWDVSASVYRKAFILRYLESHANMSNPNRLEAFLAEEPRSGANVVAPDLACFTTSRCVTLTINRVQDEYPNDYDSSKTTDIDGLYAAHLQGKQLDWARIRGLTNRVIHVDSKWFELTEEVEVKRPAYRLGDEGPNFKPGAQRHLLMRVWLWRAANRIWESLRPFLPRRILALLQALMRALAPR